MWVPICESDALKTVPLRALYWGTPIVVFRTESGRIGALHDVCAHRGVPLSLGQVRGETIRCDFHHFRFDVEGRCVETPDACGLDAARRLELRVPQYHVREALGLVWVSGDASAPFPSLLLEAAPAEVVTGSFEVRGDLRVWMDHFLDALHCLWTHAETAYGGSPDNAATFESIDIDIGPDSEYPVRSAVHMTFDLSRHRGSAQYSPVLRALAAAGRARRLFSFRRHRAERGPRNLDIDVDLVTPLCQYTHSTYRSGSSQYGFEGVTAINPIGEGRNQFLFAVFFPKAAASGISRWLQRLFLKRFVPQHLGVEDARLLAETAFVPSDKLIPMRTDATVVAMRAMFSRYVAAKGHLYPAGSLIHRLDYH
jgi:phenylpropionate dioxygenase-like ring-hydroxylating dioxygenase large terminal subunit